MKRARQAALRAAPAGALLVVTLAHCSSGGDLGEASVGVPCVVADESNPGFEGFRIAEESIESHSPTCGGEGVCLVNHFQGRVSCPLGQPAVDDPTSPRKSCTPDGPPCPSGQACVEAVSAGAPAQFVCHAPNNCQRADVADPDRDNRDENGIPKDCCVPGTDTPVVAAVCGQCDEKSRRDAEGAVYCSCRCGPPDGVAAGADETFCGCPTGFECTQVRKDFGVGDRRLAGKYCIKQGSAFQGDTLSCGVVKGHFDPLSCRGMQGL